MQKKLNNFYILSDHNRIKVEINGKKNNTFYKKIEINK